MVNLFVGVMRSGRITLTAQYTPPRGCPLFFSLSSFQSQRLSLMLLSAFLSKLPPSSIPSSSWRDAALFLTTPTLPLSFLLKKKSPFFSQYFFSSFLTYLLSYIFILPWQCYKIQVSFLTVTSSSFVIVRISMRMDLPFKRVY